MTDAPTLGSRVKALREEKGYSQNALARAVGIKQPSLWAIEHDKVEDPSSSIIHRLAEVLGTTPDYLLKKVGPRHRGDAAPQDIQAIRTIVDSMTPDEHAALLSLLRVMRANKP